MYNYGIWIKSFLNTSAKGKTLFNIVQSVYKKLWSFKVMVYIGIATQLFKQSTTYRLVSRFPYFQRVYNYGIWIKSFLNTSAKRENFAQTCTVSVQKIMELYSNGIHRYSYTAIQTVNNV